MIRISTIFIAICMVLVAASLGLILYSVAGIGGTESAIAALTALTFLILYNAVSMRLRDRTDVGGQIADLLARQVAEFGRRLAAVEGRVVSANSAGSDRIQAVVGEISELGVLVKQLAVSVAAHDDMLSSGVPAAPAPAASPEDAAPKEPPPATEEKSAVVATPVKIVEAPAPSRSQPQILTAVRNAVEENRIDIYLQPMVTLPQRKVRFYEAVTRLRDDKDQILAADDFISVAEAGGLIGRIDHMVMLRCVQVLRRLMVRNKDVGIFCNVAAATLGNPATFAQCLDFLPQSGPDRDRTSGGPGAARLPLLHRSRHRLADRAARTGRPRRPLHQGARGIAARPAADLGVGHSSIRPFRSARPLRHRPDRRTDRRRTRRGRSPRL